MYEKLSIGEILKQSAHYPVVKEYLPDEKDIPRLPRQWLINMLFTVVGEDFETWVNSRVSQRNRMRASDQNLLIDLDPAIATAFHASTHVSSR